MFSIVHRIQKQVASRSREEWIDDLLAFGIAALVIITSLMGWKSTQLWAGMLVTASFLSIILIALVTRRYPNPKQTAMGCAILGLIATILASTATSVYWFNSIVVGSRWIAALLLIPLLWQLCRRTTSLRIIISGIIVASLAVLGRGLIELPTVQYLSEGIDAAFGWRNIYGGYIVLILPLFLTWTLATPSKWTWVGSIITALLLSSLFFTFSQASWLAVALELIIMTILSARSAQRRWIPPRAWIIRLLVVGIISVLITTSLYVLWESQQTTKQQTNELSAIQSSSGIPTASITNRLEYWRAGLKITQLYPLLGAGPGNYSIIGRKFQRHPWSMSISPHNIIILILSEMGIIAIIFFLALLAIIFIQSWRMLIDKEHSRRLSPLQIGLLTGIIGGFTHILLDVDMEVPTLLYVFFIEIGVYTGLLGRLQHYSMKMVSHPLVVGSVSMLGIATLVFLLFFANADLASSTAIEMINSQGKHSEQSLQYALQATKQNPINAEYAIFAADHYRNFLWNNQGDAKINIERMIYWAQRAVRIHPEYSTAHFRLGEMYFFGTSSQHSFLGEAIKELETARALNPQNPYGTETMATAYILNKKPQKAQQVLVDTIVRYNDHTIEQMFMSEQEKYSLKEYISKLKKYHLDKVVSPKK